MKSVKSLADSCFAFFFGPSYRKSVFSSLGTAMHRLNGIGCGVFLGVRNTACPIIQLSRKRGEALRRVLIVSLGWESFRAKPVPLRRRLL